MGGAEAPGIIQRIIGRPGQSFGAVIDIEQDRVVGRRSAADQLADVRFADADARISQTIAEHFRHRTAGPRDDVFAVGVLVHEMLTGRPPAPESERLEEVRSVPSWLGELERRCLVAEPAARWADAAEALAAVARPGGGVA